MVRREGKGRRARVRMGKGERRWDERRELPPGVDWGGITDQGLLPACFHHLLIWLTWQENALDVAGNNYIFVCVCLSVNSLCVRTFTTDIGDVEKNLNVELPLLHFILCGGYIPSMRWVYVFHISYLSFSLSSKDHAVAPLLWCRAESWKEYNEWCPPESLWIIE